MGRGTQEVSPELAERLRRFYSPTPAEVAEDDARWRRRELETEVEIARAMEMGHSDARWLRVLRRWGSKRAPADPTGTPTGGAGT